MKNDGKLDKEERISESKFRTGEKISLKNILENFCTSKGWLVGLDNGYVTGYYSCIMILKDIIKNITNEQIKEIQEKWNEHYTKLREFYEVDKKLENH